MKRFLSIVALSAALAVVAAGCGESASPEEKWFGSVCTELGDWEDGLKERADAVQKELESPKLGTLAAVDAEIKGAVADSDKLTSDLRAIQPPETADGAEAERKLNALVLQIESTATEAKQTVATIPKGASTTEAAQVLLPLVPSLQGLAVNVSSTLESIQAVAKEYKDGFNKADSCERFRSD